MTKSNQPTVPLLDLKAQYATIREPVRAAIDDVCDSQWFVMGPKVKELEEQVAEYCHCTKGVGVSSGTDALLIALMALEVGPGDAVITTPYTFFATGGTISRLNARPIFCDIDADTFNIDPQRIRQVLEEDCDHDGDRVIYRATGDIVRALMPVHLYGQTADMDAFMDISREFNLPVIEDAAQSIGSEDLDGTRAGSRGLVGCFSFFPSKNLGAFGDGGMCTSNDEEIAERIRILRVHGGQPKYYHQIVGGNFRLDALQAAVLLVKLGHLDRWTEARQKNAAYYTAALERAGLVEKVGCPKTRTGARHIYNQYIVRVERRNELRDFLTENNIGTEIYYPVPLHLQECFADLGYTEGDCPASESAANETLALPVYPELMQEQMDRVVSCIADFYS